uniref:Interferon regulatory factor 3A n=1 Tax=Andrias davidianus TaxID=141262 RepID=A0A7G7LHW5_ANDDA|nr:interferon regulatory factor 3A [Andrias davidianus]
MGSQKPLIIPWLTSQIGNPEYPGLTWVNAEQMHFRIPWKHGLRHDRSDQDFRIFQGWAIANGTYRPGIDEPKPSEWKRNLRSALNRKSEVMVMEDHSSDSSDPHKVYAIISQSRPESEERPARAPRGTGQHARPGAQARAQPGAQARARAPGHRPAHTQDNRPEHNQGHRPAHAPWGTGQEASDDSQIPGSGISPSSDSPWLEQPNGGLSLNRPLEETLGLMNISLQEVDGAENWRACPSPAGCIPGELGPSQASASLIETGYAPETASPYSSDGMELIGFMQRTRKESPLYSIWLCLGEHWPDPSQKPWTKKFIMVQVTPVVFKLLHEISYSTGASSLRSSEMNLQISDSTSYESLLSYLQDLEEKMEL